MIFPTDRPEAIHRILIFDDRSSSGYSADLIFEPIQSKTYDKENRDHGNSA
jgi:hypothetical protein